MKSKVKTNAARQGFAPAAQNWVPRPRRAKMVGELIPALMRPAFEKFGFPAAAILTEWAAIAGPDLAAFTAPERLKWPRGAGSSEGAERGATLILRVSGARALEVEHLRPQLIERINAMFGYRAVSEIRIIQAPLPRDNVQTQRPRPAGSEFADDDARLAGLPADRLRTALARMAAGIRARQNNVASPC